MTMIVLNVMWRRGTSTVCMSQLLMRWGTAGQFTSKNRVGDQTSQRQQSTYAEMKEKGKGAELERELPPAFLAATCSRKHRSPSHMRGMINNESHVGNSVIENRFGMALQIQIHERTVEKQEANGSKEEGRTETSIMKTR